jgi:Flp pilus assembly protein TadD
MKGQKPMRKMPFVRAACAVLLGLVVAGPAVAADSGGSSTPRIAELTQAQAAIDKKQFQAAVPMLQAALAKQPDSADAWNLMGYAHRKLGMTDKALGYYQKALAIDNDHRGALEYLGELYLETGRPEDAKKMLKRLDDVCFFGCPEYNDLKKALRAAKVID